MRRRRSWTLGLAVSVGTVAVVTGAIYGLREVVPVVSTGVVYLLAVLLVSTPTNEFTIADGEHWVALGVFLVAAGVPVDSRIERGRTPRHALAALLENEGYDTLVVPAKTSATDGFDPADIAWLLENAPGEVLVLRPEPATFGYSRRSPAMS